ncbi:MAG: hypothetical protein ACOYN0_16790 [Phycisphaerales bacterium]
MPGRLKCVRVDAASVERRSEPPHGPRASRLGKQGPTVVRSATGVWYNVRRSQSTLGAAEQWRAAARADPLELEPSGCG